MSELLAGFDGAEAEAIVDAPHPQWCVPMLATLTNKRFSHRDWLFERKLDGERALCFRDGERVRLLTRNRKDIGRTYPELVDALAAQTCRDFVVDGEIVAFEGSLTSFARLQGRMQIGDPDRARKSGIAVFYYLFDILHADGFDLRGLPLQKRKAILKRALSFSDPLRYTAHRNRDGEAFFEEACKKGWEGLIAKDARAPYGSGRSTGWLKFKCAHGQELVIGGFTAPRGSRIGFGALLVGYYEDGRLRYAGKVGTGYGHDFLKSFRARLDEIVRDASPFDERVAEPNATWVHPRFVGEFGFTEWTSSGKLRHPRFIGLRDDKAAKDVVREVPGA